VVRVAAAVLGLAAAGEALAAAGWVDFAAGGASSAGSPSFSGTTTATESATPPSTYQCSPCTGTFNGAFYGPGAKFAGYAYLLDTGTSGGKVSGAAAFGR